MRGSTKDLTAVRSGSRRRGRGDLDVVAGSNGALPKDEHASSTFDGSSTITRGMDCKSTRRRRRPHQHLNHSSPKAREGISSFDGRVHMPDGGFFPVARDTYYRDREIQATYSRARGGSSNTSISTTPHSSIGRGRGSPRASGTLGREHEHYSSVVDLDEPTLRDVRRRPDAGRSGGRTTFQGQQQNVHGDGKSERRPTGRIENCRSWEAGGETGVEDRSFKTRRSRPFSSRQQDTIPCVGGYVEDVGGFGNGSNKERVEGRTLAETMGSSSTVLPSPCHSARSRSGVTWRHQLADPRPRQESVPPDARGRRRVDRSDCRATAFPGTRKPNATNNGWFLKHEGDADSHQGERNGSAHGGWSSTSSIDPRGGSRSRIFKGEGGLVSTSKSGHGRATIGLGNSVVDWETLLGGSMNVCRGDEHSRAVSEALARAEALARQEVEAAQAGAAAERTARAIAEAALSEARASLRHTNEWLQESLANGPRVALAALLEEKEAATAAAAKAMEEAAAGTRGPKKTKNRAGKELSQLMNLRDETTMTRQFRAALSKARSDALTSRARASALQHKLDQADVSGLQATIASLAADKAAAQSRAAELEARLARVARDYRHRAEKSRRANAVAADRLSAAESRAQAAEARVETVARHLTLSERRLREAEQRRTKAAESARRKEAEERDHAAVAEAAALDGGVARKEDAGGRHHKPACGWSVGDAALVGHQDAECSTRHGNNNDEGSCGTRSAPLPSSGTESHRHGRTPRKVANEEQWTRHVSDFADEKLQHGDTAALQENRDPAGHLTVALGLPTSSDNDDAANILREVQAARQQVAVAEQQAVALRVDANRVKVEAAQTAAEAEIGKERAMMESERLARELKATGVEVHALKCALNSARSEQAEASRVHPDSRADFPPSELSDSQGATKTGGEKDDGGAIGTPVAATTSSPQERPILGEQQPAQHVHHQETLPVSKLKGPENYIDVPATQSIGSNNAQEEGAGRAEEGNFSNNHDGSGQPGSTSAEEGDTTVVHGESGARRKASAALLVPPPGDALAADESRRPLSEQIVRETPQHPGLPLLPLTEDLSPRTARAEIRRLGRDLAETRTAADEATASRRRAEGRIEELEEVIAESEKRHEMFRERGEARLETLKRAFAQEQEEGGAHIALATLLEEKYRSETRALELERHVTEMTAAVRAAQTEADQLKADLKTKEEKLLVGEAHDVQPPEEETTTAPVQDADGMHAHRASIPVLRTRTPDGDPDRSRPFSTSARPRESTAVADGTLHAVIAPNTCGGQEEEEEPGEKADAATTVVAAHVQHGEVTPSPSASRLAEAEERIASAENALLNARSSSQEACEQTRLLGQELEHARAAAGAEAEDKRLAHARIAELERDISVMGLEQEAIRARAEARLEALRAAFEQEELEAGGKAALECLLDEKAELATHAEELEIRLREAEARATAAEASRTILLPAADSTPSEPGQAARAGQTAYQERGGDGGGTVETTGQNDTGGRSPEGAEHAGAAAEERTTTPRRHHQRQQELLLRQAETAASQSRAEVDRLWGELERTRADQALAAAAAAEEREAAARRVLGLEAAIEETKREYLEHRDRAESRLETLRVAFDQENEENDPQMALAILLEEKGQAEERVANESRRPLSEQIVRETPQPPGLPLQLPLTGDLSPQTAGAEIRKLARDLAETRTAADESRRRAEGRVAELEEVIAESERRQDVFRGRGEARLETLRRAFVQEQEEEGAHIALATLLEEKSRAETRALELERRVTDMAAAVRSAQMEADQLKADLKTKEETLLVGEAQDDQPPEEETTTAPVQDADGMHAHRASIPVIRTRTLDGDADASARLRESSTATADGTTHIPLNAVAAPNTCDGREEEPGEKADAATTVVAAHVQHGEVTPSPSASRLAEAEERIASAENALLNARSSSQEACERTRLLGQELEHARAAAGAEAEDKRLAHARIAELERDISVMGLEQEAIRARAKARLEALKEAFEQEELEAGGKAALECLINEKAELETHAEELETRLREAEATAAAAVVVAAAAASRTTLLAAEENTPSEPGQAARAGQTAHQERSGDGGGAAETTVVNNTGGRSPEGAEHAGAAAEERTITQHRHQQRQQELLLRQAETVASQSRAEADHLRGELERTRADQALAAAAAAEEREAAARRVSGLEAAIEETKREYREHRDRAESRLETLRVAFDQENEENDPQMTLAILLEEKGQAEERAADAHRAADETRSEMELVRKRAEEVIRASEQASAALRANMAEETAARILAEIDSKYCEAGEKPSRGGLAVVGPDNAATRNQSLRGENTAASVVAEIHRRFETTHQAAQTAGAVAFKAEAELGRVRGEAEAALRRQREAASSLVTDAQRAVLQASTAAAERVAAGEGALQKARAEVSRLRGELERAQEVEAANRAEAEETKAEVSGKIARLEGDLREAVAEHQRCRRQAELEIGQLRATLERRDEAERGTIAEGTLSAAGEEPAAAAAAAVAGTEVAAEQRRRVESSRHELRVAEQAVAEAKGEVESLRGELARTVETVATAKTQQEVAEARIAELEEELKDAAREHALFREEVEERLLVLKASFEEEHVQNGAQAALTALCQDHDVVERRAADELRAAGEIRSDLELQLEAANDALGAAEERLKALGLEKAAAAAAAAAAAGRVDSSGGGGGGGRQASLETGDNGEAGRGEGGTALSLSGDVLEPEAATRSRGGVLPDTEQNRRHHDEAGAPEDDEPLHTGRSRAARDAATAAAATATQERVSELVRATRESEQTRALAEARLEEVQRQLRQEERERRKVQTGMASLLQEKREAEAHAAEAERFVEEARAAASRAEGKVSALEAQLRDASSQHVVDSIALERGAVVEEGARTEALQAAEQLAAREVMLQDANQALESSRGEVEDMRRRLERARGCEREAAAAVEGERRAAQEKIAELESAIERSDREHRLLREKTEGRLELLRSAVEQEEQENASQVALAELLAEKSRAEGLADELSQKLHHADEALREAEARAASLKDVLEEAEARAAASAAAAEEAACLAAAERAVDTIVTAAVTTAEGLRHARRAVEDAVAASDASRATEHETLVAENKRTARAAQEETERLRGEAGNARAGETAARDEAAAARARLSELEEAMEVSQRSHDSFRERTERRLESLRAAVEDEELEQGAQAALECLLHEKNEEQAKVADLEARLLRACEAARTTEAEVRAVRTELERVESLNAELLEASSAAAMPPPPPPAVALLDRQRLEARLDGLRVAVEEEEEENGVQVSLSVLLEEKWELESRVLKLEEQLREAHEVVCRGEEAASIAAAAADAAEKMAVVGRADASIETTTPPLTPRQLSTAAPPVDYAEEEAARATAAATAAAAATRAAKAEAALSEALEAVAELEARCAAAHTRESEVTRQANERVEGLVRELEEANGHASKATVGAVVEGSAPRPSDPANTAAGVEVLEEVDVGEEHEDPAEADDDGNDHAPLSVGSDDHACGSEDGAGEGGTILALLAQRDGLLREKERLKQEAEKKLYARHEATYRHVIDVGRYELSLDILEEDLDHAREKLAEAVQLRGEDDEQLQTLFHLVCQRAKNAEDAKKRVDEQLAETQEQLVLVCQALGGAAENTGGTDCRRQDNDAGGRASPPPAFRGVPAQRAQALPLKPSTLTTSSAVAIRAGHGEAAEQDETTIPAAMSASVTTTGRFGIAARDPEADKEAGEGRRRPTSVQGDDAVGGTPGGGGADPSASITGAAAAVEGEPLGTEGDFLSLSPVTATSTVSARDADAAGEPAGSPWFTTEAEAAGLPKASGAETHHEEGCGTRPPALASVAVPTVPVPDPSDADGKGILGSFVTGEGAVKTAGEVIENAAALKVGKDLSERHRGGRFPDSETDRRGDSAPSKYVQDATEEPATEGTEEEGVPSAPPPIEGEGAELVPYSARMKTTPVVEELKGGSEFTVSETEANGYRGARNEHASRRGTGRHDAPGQDRTASLASPPLRLKGRKERPPTTAEDEAEKQAFSRSRAGNVHRTNSAAAAAAAATTSGFITSRLFRPGVGKKLRHPVGSGTPRPTPNARGATAEIEPREDGYNREEGGEEAVHGAACTVNVAAGQHDVAVDRGRAEQATSSSPGTPPVLRRRRSSDALFGLRRLSSIHTMRQGQQQHDHHRQQTAPDPELRAHSLGPGGAAAAEAAEGGESEECRSRSQSRPSSPESRGGRAAESGEEVPRVRREEEGRAQPRGRGREAARATMASPEARTEGGSEKFDSPPRCSRDEGGKAQNAPTPTGEDEDMMHPSPGGSRAKPRAEKAAVNSAVNVALSQRKTTESSSSSTESRRGVTTTELAPRPGEGQQHGQSPASAAARPDGTDERKQLQDDHVTDNGSEETAAAAVAAVRTKSTRHKRGRSVGLLSSIRGAVANKTTSTKTTRGRVRSESPPARG